MPMLFSVLLVTAFSLAIVMLGAHLSREHVRATLTALHDVRSDLRPALVRVTTDAQRATALRQARIDEHDAFER